MDRLLYVAMSGAKQTLVSQAANSHNLANLHTAGFRADLNQFRSMPVFGEGLPTRVYAMSERPGIDLTPGPIESTGRELDVAIRGEGWIAVQAPDGEEAYTRAGDLRVSGHGLLETGAGYSVLGNAGPIAIPPAEKIEIGHDGTISVRPLGLPSDSLAEIDRIKLVNPAPELMYKDSDGLFRLEGSAGPIADAGVTLVPGSLERSNVNAVDAMVNMITLARRFEMQVKMMHAAEETDRSAASILQLS
nr:flagellar basal body rod protein FlgF [Gammaproteobacteria bacterium]